MATIIKLDYLNLELDKALKSIRENKPKRVLIQLPDGLKPYALEIINELQKRFQTIEFYIWAGSCFGACDIPIAQAKSFNIDLIIHFGHERFVA